MKGLRVLCAVLLLVVFAAIPAVAEDAFHVTYRQANVTSDGLMRTGDVLLNIYNTSGEPVKDMEAWVDDDDSVTYDHHHIFIGDLANGQQTEVLAPFSVSEEPVKPASMAAWTTWTLEYTDASGQRVEVRIDGQGVQ